MTVFSRQALYERIWADPVRTVAKDLGLSDVGRGSPNWQSTGYSRVRSYADENASSPWRVLCLLDEGAVTLPYAGPLVERFRFIRADLDRLTALNAAGGLAAVIEDLFPPDDQSVRDLRSLAIGVLAENQGADPESFLRELSAAIAKPEIPLEVEDVRIMSLHKSKGLSAPVTIIAGCIEGLLPKQPDVQLPAAEATAQLEEQRRLFYVGITRVKAEPAVRKPGALLLTYSRVMPLRTAKRAGIEPAQVNYGYAQLIASRFIREMAPAAPRPIAG